MSVRACLLAWVQRGRAGVCVCVCVRVRALLLWCFRGDRLIFVFMSSYFWPSRMTDKHHNRPKSVVVKVLVFYPCSLLCIPFNISMVKIPHYNTVSFTHFTNSIMYVFVVLFGYIAKTIYYSNGNCCMPCN